MLLDNYADSFPLWLHPIQIRLIAVGEADIAFCEFLAEKYRYQARIEIDDRAESVSKKIKHAHYDLVPWVVVIGEKEAASSEVPELVAALAKIEQSQKDKPFIPLQFPNLLSKQIK